MHSYYCIILYIHRNFTVRQEYIDFYLYSYMYVQCTIYMFNVKIFSTKGIP